MTPTPPAPPTREHDDPRLRSLLRELLAALLLFVGASMITATAFMVDFRAGFAIIGVWAIGLGVMLARD